MSLVAPTRRSMPRKLKVYRAQFGFYDTVVSAPSQAAALRAWGTHRNLFADGEARVETDERAIEIALAHPEIPLRRGIGTVDPFSLEPRPPRLPDLPRTGKPKPTKSKPKAAAKPPPDRSALDAAEKALDAIEQERQRTEEHFAERRAALEAEEAVARKDYAAARSKAEAAVARERAAYGKAEGSA